VLDPFGFGFEVEQVTDWYGQRKQFRAAALTALRKREGLPSPVDVNGVALETRFDDQGKAHYYDASGNKVDKVMFAGAGKDGKPGGFAIGKRKGAGIDEAEKNWNKTDTAFQILEVSEDGKKLSDELNDLDRDSRNFQLSEKVSHGSQSEQAPDLALSNLSDEEVESKLQEYLKRGPR
jgi:hypothetical protein